MESLAIVRNRGKPHLFITMTCNPNHPQILKALPHRASPNNRPDIVLRVFRQQVQQLVYVLQNKLVPGWEGLKGNILVIEFQKRGLPHVHILAILDRTNNITADEIKNMQQQRYQVKMIVRKTGKCRVFYVTSSMW